MSTSKNNRQCVSVDELNGLHFMIVHRPERATVSIMDHGDVSIVVNESCVFTIHGAGTLMVYDNRKVKPA